MAARLQWPQYMEPEAQTDRLRIEFLMAELNLTSTFLQIASAEFDSGEREHAHQSLLDAKKGCETVTRFLSDPKHSGRLTKEQFQNLHQRIGELEEDLARLSRKTGLG